MRAQPLDLAAVRTQPVARRAHLVHADAFASPPRAGATFADFVESLPRILKADDLRAVVDALAAAVHDGKPVILGMGGHVIKCGLGPVVVDLIRRGAVSAIALNGGAAIHDFELAMLGATSEDVEANLRDGSYGMVSETGRWMQEALEQAADEGFGAALGRWLDAAGAPHRATSVLHAAYQTEIPATVHVAIGTDTLHMLPGANGALLGKLSHRDFRLLAGVVSGLQEGGVYVNAGSAVVLPEVFLKCVTLCRNLGHLVRGFTTVDLDMVRHYRPSVNVVERYATLGARGYALTGHHEIMLPLIAFALVERPAAPAMTGARSEVAGG